MSTKFLDFFSKRKPLHYSPCCFTVCSGAPQQNRQLCLLVITILHEKLPIYSTKNLQGVTQGNLCFPCGNVLEINP